MNEILTTELAAKADQPASSVRSRRIDDIEWLRAVAILGVLSDHAQGALFTWGTGWYAWLISNLNFGAGVDIFFAISGFVIARSLIPLLLASPLSGISFLSKVGSFWTARAFRLLPSAWLWLGLMLLASWGFNATGAFSSFHANAMATLAGLLQVANFRFADSFASYPYGASFAYWSLSLEEQFYLALPLLLLLLRKRIVVLLFFVIIFQCLIPRNLILMATRTDALAWGVLLAIFSESSLFTRAEPRTLADRRWLQCLISLILIFSIGKIFSMESIAIGHRVSLVAILAALLVWLAAYDRNYLSGANSCLKSFMLWTGQRSYAIYLIHIPVYFSVREAWFRLNGSEAQGGVIQFIVFFLAAAILIATLAEANFRLVEMPLRKVGKRLAARIVASADITLSTRNTAGESRQHV